MEHNSHFFPNTMSTLSGHVIDPGNFTPEDYKLDDFTSSLLALPRFLSHTNCGLSIGTHEILVALMVWKHTHNPQWALRGLHHDDSEAILSDLSSAVKHLPQLQGYRDLEKHIQACCFEAIGLGPDPLGDEAVKLADQKVCNLELEFRELAKSDVTDRTVIMLTREFGTEYGLYMRIHDVLSDKKKLPMEIDAEMGKVVELVEDVLDKIHVTLHTKKRRKQLEQESKEYFDNLQKVSL